MHIFKLSLSIVFTFFALRGFSQGKKPLDHTVYDSWKSARNAQISNDGKWVIYTLRPQEGNANLKVHDLKKDEQRPRNFERAASARVTEDSRFVVFRIKPQLDSVKSLRRKKTKKDKLPKDSLGVYDLTRDTLITFPRIKSFKTPKKGAGWIAFLLEKEIKKKKKKSQKDSLEKEEEGKENVEENKKEKEVEEEKKRKKKKKKEEEETEPVEEEKVAFTEEEKLQQKVEELEQKLAEIVAEKKAKEEAKKKKKPKKEGKDTGTRLVLRNLLTARQDTFAFVKDYIFDEKGTKLAFVSTGDDSTFKAGVYVYDLKASKLNHILNKAGKFKNLAWDEVGSQLAFVADTDTTKKNKKALIRYFDLYYWNTKQKTASILAKKGSAGLNKEWLINEHADLEFAKDGSKLYFGTNPKPFIRDTTLLKEEIVRVDIWHWKDGRLQSEQNVNLKDDQKKSYRAVVYPRAKKIVQLGSPKIPNIMTGMEGNADFAIGYSNEPYARYRSWEGYPAYYDLYYIAYKDGKAIKIKTKLRASNMNLSPNAQFLSWYAVADSAWFTHELRTGTTHNLTKKIDNKFYNELHDTPQNPYPYGRLGWTEDDKEILIYDRFDVWRFSPNNRTPAKKLTEGRKNRMRYRYVKLDPEERFLKYDQELILSAFDEETKAEGYFSYSLNNADFRKLIFDDYAFSNLQKAKNANQYIFRRESFEDYPDLYYSDQRFTKINRLSYANPQQENYLWGTVEMVKWTGLSGEELTGLLYKPENFDESKKYPMITYFYERSSQQFHYYISPTPSPSTIRRSVYTSNGYVVFVPDIPYRLGYPGQSAYDAVVSGVTHILDMGFVDRDKLGIQGQSWGGYQVAHLVTKTDLFAAAMAGAPVSNMTSAYGGIRWRTGLSRMFQYERSQSRIGGTLWEKPFLYLENSPIFNVDKINTPLLIMHNDGDGAVPWYQGIELFVALRRLEKPAWMLNYNGEEHNLVKRQNRKDLSRRMLQFFDYYLKYKSAPRWLKEGMPAVEKGINKGYELVDR